MYFIKKSSSSFSSIASMAICIIPWLLKIEMVHTLQYIYHQGCNTTFVCFWNPIWKFIVQAALVILVHLTNCDHKVWILCFSMPYEVPFANSLLSSDKVNNTRRWFCWFAISFFHSLIHWSNTALSGRASHNKISI